MDNTREKLIELLRQPIKLMKERLGAPTFEIKAPFAEQIADHLIASGVTVQEWISVKDRLPDKPGYYLAWWHGHSCPEGMIDVLNFDGTVFPWTTLWTAVKNEVTHWMPLPQPPKGE